MIYGITPKGFVRKRLPTIRAEIIETMTAKLSAIAGKAVVLKTTPDSIQGAQIDTYAEREAELWERMEAQYFAMYPHTSEGVNQDNAVAFTGVRRNTESKSSVYVMVHAVNGTTLPAGTQITSDFDQSVFELVEPLVVSQNTASAFRIEVASLLAGAQYTVTVNGTQHTFTAPEPGASVNGILSSVLTFLQTLGINASIENAGVDAELDGRSTVSVGVGPKLLLARIESTGLFRAVNAGPIEVPIGSITRISSANANVLGARNILPAAVGRNNETDEELAERYEEGPFRLGTGTAPAIRANLRQNVPGITDLQLVENTYTTTDPEGRPAGSIEIIVDGGDDTEIRNEIYRVKAASTPAFGLSTQVVCDSEGTPHSIGFTRPISVYVWVTVRVVIRQGSTVNATTFQQIQALVPELGSQYRIGEDVIRQLFTGPIFELTDSIYEIELKLFGTTQPNVVPTLDQYTEENIVIGTREKARFSFGRVTVF